MVALRGLELLQLFLLKVHLFKEIKKVSGSAFRRL
jgi:hypothetical protein